MDPQHYAYCNAGIDGLAALLADTCSLHEMVLSYDGETSIQLGDTISDPTPTAEEQIIIDETTAGIEEDARAFIMSLSPYMRCVVVRSFWFNQSPQEIADSLGRKRAAIYNALSRIGPLGQKFFAEARMT